ncbi:hypothetical protein [Chryseobacterium sp. WLY505]|uniref:hypothetical protein n=1 Tax=Chryseobacterium sp. WLY505 TaxID=3068892 RepID=UPI002796A329|nr:hypothetical protein [Chryseobacterium sp. WLY505]MDQ1856096.1 hypothetical protein [Chryseobacterium sp. WLY505]
MEKIKKAYYYIFYKIYKSIIYTSDKVGGEFWSDFKAGIALLALELWFFGTILNYYAIITHTKFSTNTIFIILLIPLVFLSILHYFAFIHTDIWKEYSKQFDKLSEEKNKKGTIIVCIIAVFIASNFLGSIFLLQKFIF